MSKNLTFRAHIPSSRPLFSTRAMGRIPVTLRSFDRHHGPCVKICPKYSRYRAELLRITSQKSIIFAHDILSILRNINSTHLQERLISVKNYTVFCSIKSTRASSRTVQFLKTFLRLQIMSSSAQLEVLIASVQM